MAYIRERNGRFYFTISLGRDKVTGKRIKKEFGGFKTKAEAERECDLKYAELTKANEPFTPSNITLGLCWEEYIQQAKLTLKATTISRQKSIYNTHIYKFDRMPVKDITFKDIDDLQTELQGKLNANYIRTIIIIFNNILKYAVDSGYIRTNPIKQAKKIRVENEEIRIPTEEEMRAIEDTLPSDQLLPYMLAKHLGLRTGECLGLRWSDFNWHEGKFGTVTISRQLLVNENNTRFIIGSLKTPKSHRTLFINQALSTYLKSTYAIQKSYRESVIGYIKEHTFYSTIENKEVVIDDLVCVGSNGAYLRPNHIAQFSKCVRDKLGYEWFHFHTLRHYWASFLLRNRISVATVSRMLGHSNVENTLRIYSPYIPSDDLMGTLDNL